MSEESLEKYEGIVDENGLIDYDGLLHLIEQKKQLETQVATLKREIDYAWDVNQFIDPKGYGTDGDGWFDLCWEYRDIGAAEFWEQEHDTEPHDDAAPELTNKFGYVCTEHDDCPVCIKLAEE
ncbi:MAG: hypothetical protein VW715_12515 [Rhodospirillales bacterium]